MRPKTASRVRIPPSPPVLQRQTSVLRGAFLFSGIRTALKGGCIFPLFGGAQALDPVFGLRCRGAVRVRLEAEQATGRMGAGVAGAGAVAVGGVARFDIDGDAGVQAAIRAFDHVQEPGAIVHGRWLASVLRGYAVRYLLAWPWSKPPARD